MILILETEAATAYIEVARVWVYSDGNFNYRVSPADSGPVNSITTYKSVRLLHHGETLWGNSR